VNVKSEERVFMFSKRLGENSKLPQCSGGYSCPQLLEMCSGDFAAAGEDKGVEIPGLMARSERPEM
jgi:hypothetical protein